jgi:hypothetical protein
VYKGGTLKVQGTKDKPVVFQGLRRELSLQEEPGQWDRIWINDGGINEIDYAIIKTDSSDCRQKRSLILPCPFH